MICLATPNLQPQTLTSWTIYTTGGICYITNYKTGHLAQQLLGRLSLQ